MAHRRGPGEKRNHQVPRPGAPLSQSLVGGAAASQRTRGKAGREGARSVIGCDNCLSPRSAAAVTLSANQDRQTSDGATRSQVRLPGPRGAVERGSGTQRLGVRAWRPRGLWNSPSAPALRGLVVIRSGGASARAASGDTGRERSHIPRRQPRADWAGGLAGPLPRRSPRLRGRGARPSRAAGEPKALPVLGGLLRYLSRPAAFLPGRPEAANVLPRGREGRDGVVGVVGLQRAQALMTVSHRRGPLVMGRLEDKQILPQQPPFSPPNLFPPQRSPDCGLK